MRYVACRRTQLLEVAGWESELTWALGQLAIGDSQRAAPVGVAAHALGRLRGLPPD